MKCPKCGSDRVWICDSKIKHPHQRWFECVDCLYKSRRVDRFIHRCLNFKRPWEIELDELYKEWDYQGR